MARKTADDTERPTGGRSIKGRTYPFIWHWAMALVAVPGAATGLWLLGRRDPQVRALIAFLDVLATWAVVTFAFKLAEHAKRKPIIAWHTAGTVFGVGFVWGLTTVAGWSLTWAVVYFFAAVVGAASWNLHRVDALRARSDKEGDDKGLAEILGIPHARFGKPKVTDNTITATVTVEPGGTVADVQSALPKIEAAAQGAIPGRGRVVQDPSDAKVAELTLSRQDALRTWLPWPGPSAPGGSIAQPIITGYYEDGAQKRYWLCAGLDDDGAPRVGTHIGRMGMAGSGKSGDAKLELAELMTRCDVVVLYADATKGQQTARPLMSGITLYADTPQKGKILFRGVRQLVRDRADRLGFAGFADWTPDCFAHAQLRMPAVVVFVDEADELITDPAFTWLATKARSTGVFLSVTLPRADHVSMPPTARFSIGIWECFGTGDDYSADFALTDATQKAGAHPEAWRNTKPGYHFLDTAPGVDPRLFPVPARSFQHTDAEIEAVVLAHAHQRAGLPPQDVVSLGQAWEFCQPGDARRPGTEQRKPVPRVPDEDDYMDDDEGDEDVRIPAMAEDAEISDGAEYAAEDPTQPIPPVDDDGLRFDDGKPDATSPGEAAQAFDALLVRLAGEGRTEVRVVELVEQFPFRSGTWLSRRLSAVADGAVVSPPGLTLERTETAGRYVIHRLNGGHTS
jgi:hypothetical protein